jgi:hypothetical protein
MNFKARMTELEATGLSKATAYNLAKAEFAKAKADQPKSPKPADGGCQACWMPKSLCHCND